jgi:dihydrofolate reductase
MRKVTFGGANSFDNYIARKDGTTGWLYMGDETDAKETASITTEYWKTIDTVVMGRKTYEVALRSGMTSYPGVKNYVFSRTLKASPDKKVEIISEDAAEFVRNLKNQKGKGICVMGGGLLAKSLFEASLIDEIGFVVLPILLGSGIPLFHEMKHQIDLELLDCKTFKNGSVFVSYRVKK